MVAGLALVFFSSFPGDPRRRTGQVCELSTHTRADGDNEYYSTSSPDSLYPIENQMAK